MSRPKFLTKSRFKVGHECPRKLNYLDNPSFVNVREDDAFLKALAKGGFQVGALAKAEYSNGVEVKTKEKSAALEQTDELLKREVAVIFEGAFQFENYFIRADIVRKNGNSIELIEVKSKSLDDDEEFFNKKHTGLMSDWEPYIADIAFQKWVLKKSKSKFNVTACLLLADKSKTATVDGLNQIFFLKNLGDGNVEVEIKADLKSTSLGESILTKRNVDSEINFLWSQRYLAAQCSWDQYLEQLASAYVKGASGERTFGGVCRKCEFRADASELNGKMSGFAECWSEHLQDKSILLKKEFSFDVPSLNYHHRDAMLEEGAFSIAQITEDYLEEKPRDDRKLGMSNSQRQWKFINQVLSGTSESYLDKDGLRKELRLDFPLHFIDFETARVAIPFNKDRRPYEQIAFQFSHHQLDEDGTLRHRDQYINVEPGIFPNFDFVRALKKALGKDHGTVLRYAAHENTVLSEIRTQLLRSQEKDRDDLVAFIESIATAPKPKSKKESLAWRTVRPMVDLCDLVKRFYLSPAMQGSASLKIVLPTILNESKYLQNKYSKPIYGPGGIQSLNFKTPVTWIKLESNGQISDPYQVLDPVFTEYDLERIERIMDDEDLRDGGAAMTAYAMMQFTEMSAEERQKRKEALLRYCELDTLAMVMLYEFWKNAIDESRDAAA